ncbi:MAG: ComEC/Rec2 family competence protein, partial [Sphingomonadales bacterium]
SSRAAPRRCPPPRVALRFPVKKWAALAAIPVAGFYLLLSGSGIPATRAFLMAALVMLAVAMDRNPVSLRMLAVAGVAILLMTPEALLSASFQMSFSAVAGLIAAYEAYARYRIRHLAARGDGAPGKARFGRIPRYFLAIVVTTLIAEVVLAPSVLYHFNRHALYGILGNLVAMPLMAMWIMPAGVLGMVLMPFGLDGVPFRIMGEGVDLMVATARFVSALPGAELPVPAFSGLSYGIIMLAFITVILLRGRARLVAVPMLVAGLVLAVATPRPGLLVDGRGQVMAVAGPDGRFWFPPGRAGQHARRVAMERSGVWRQSRWAWGPDGGAVDEGIDWLRCDGQGCIYRPPGVRGVTVALVRDPVAALEDCRMADLVVALERLDASCQRTATVIDWAAIREWGGHAVHFGPAGIGTIETVADHRGQRPWSR